MVIRFRHLWVTLQSGMLESDYLTFAVRLITPAVTL